MRLYAVLIRMLAMATEGALLTLEYLERRTETLKKCLLNE